MTATETSELNDLMERNARTRDEATKAFESGRDLHATYYQQKARAERAEIHRRCLKVLAIGAVYGS